MKLDELLTSAEVYGTLADKEYILNCTRNLRESSLQFKIFVPKWLTSFQMFC